MKRSRDDELSAEEREKIEDEDFRKGPLSVILKACQDQSQVLVSCRNNKKLLGRVKAFDRHFNLILEDVTEIWSELPQGGKGRKKALKMNKTRYISKMFLRGDSVILVVQNPKQ